jgi:exodeoxyribonuclease VII small subunit
LSSSASGPYRACHAQSRPIAHNQPPATTQRAKLAPTGGDLLLERSLELFEKGMRLTDACRKQLEEAETRVDMLIRKEGKIQAEPYRPEKA